MKMHGDELVEIRVRMEGFRCESEKPAPNLFAKAENAIDDFKRDQKVLFKCFAEQASQETPAAGRGPANPGRCSVTRM